MPTETIVHQPHLAPRIGCTSRQVRSLTFCCRLFREAEQETGTRFRASFSNPKATGPIHRFRTGGKQPMADQISIDHTTFGLMGPIVYTSTRAMPIHCVIFQIGERVILLDSGFGTREMLEPNSL